MALISFLIPQNQMVLTLPLQSAILVRNNILRRVGEISIWVNKPKLLYTNFCRFLLIHYSKNNFTEPILPYSISVQFLWTVILHYFYSFKKNFFSLFLITFYFIHYFSLSWIFSLMNIASLMDSSYSKNMSCPT